jgi:nitrite reductase (NADH) small subunit
MAEVFVCKSDALIEGGVLIWRHGSLEVGIFRHNGKLYCYRNTCPHQGGPVCEGVRRHSVEDIYAADGLFIGQRYNLNDMHIVCPWHGYEFHMDTGTHAGDAAVRLQKFEACERDGEIYVDL